MIISLSAACAAPPRLRDGATNTRELFCRSKTGLAATAPCFVLHRMGFFVPRSLRAGRWALTPPFHPDLRPLLRATAGGLFSVTLSVKPDFGPEFPRVLRGMLPEGVRTFLWSGF